MNNEEYGKIIAKNLKRIAYENEKTQADIARDLKLKQATVSSWMTGTRVPRMDKIDLLCNYFNCKRVDIMEPHDDDIRKTVDRTLAYIIAMYELFDEDDKSEIVALIRAKEVKYHSKEKNYSA